MPAYRRTEVDFREQSSPKQRMQLTGRASLLSVLLCEPGRLGNCFGDQLPGEKLAYDTDAAPLQKEEGPNGYRTPSYSRG